MISWMNWQYRAELLSYSYTDFHTSIYPYTFGHNRYFHEIGTIFLSNFFRRKIKPLYSYVSKTQIHTKPTGFKAQLSLTIPYFVGVEWLKFCSDIFFFGLISWGRACFYAYIKQSYAENSWDTICV